MTRNIDKDYSSLASVLQFSLDQFRRTIHVSIPALIVEFDPFNRRATVQPAIRSLVDDDDDGDQKRAVNRAPIFNVPVLFPSTPRAVLYLHLRQGDPVMLLTSERGLTEFKKAFAISNPDVSGVLRVHDVVAIPGFGAPGAIPLGNPHAEASLGATDGRQRMEINPDNVSLHSGASSVVLAGDDLTISCRGNVDIQSARLRHNNVDVGSDHRHSPQGNPPVRD